MVFIKATALLSLLAIVSAAPTVNNLILKATWDSAKPAPFNNQVITASGLKFWIGKPTESYCPDDIKNLKACPAGKETAISAHNYAALSVTVPGGQQIYIDAKTGALSYTQAHSASMTPGSIVDGFQVVSSKFGSGYQPKKLIANVDPKTKQKRGDFLACPTKKGAKTYQVFFQSSKKSVIADKNVPSKNKKDCIYLAIIGEITKAQSSAWQYI
ncbi:hypothetical protein ABW20_dc0105921 [Dactylellina cionopaga]|nr:hypothetical protein ABW20_dc0105921 [Dactylellina cionopaga]